MAEIAAPTAAAGESPGAVCSVLVCPPTSAAPNQRYQRLSSARLSSRRSPSPACRTPLDARFDEQQPLDARPEQRPLASAGIVTWSSSESDTIPGEPEHPQQQQQQQQQNQEQQQQQSREEACDGQETAAALPLRGANALLPFVSSKIVWPCAESEFAPSEEAEQEAECGTAEGHPGDLESHALLPDASARIVWPSVESIPDDEGQQRQQPLQQPSTPKTGRWRAHNAQRLHTSSASARIVWPSTDSEDLEQQATPASAWGRKGVRMSHAEFLMSCTSDVSASIVWPSMDLNQEDGTWGSGSGSGSGSSCRPTDSKDKPGGRAAFAAAMRASCALDAGSAPLSSWDLTEEEGTEGGGGSTCNATPRQLRRLLKLYESDGDLATLTWPSPVVTRASTPTRPAFRAAATTAAAAAPPEENRTDGKAPRDQHVHHHHYLHQQHQQRHQSESKQLSPLRRNSLASELPHPVTTLTQAVQPGESITNASSSHDTLAPKLPHPITDLTHAAHPSES
ncbi:hypothetical protein DUNSADRAFT_11456, partial [Dunaliella salina]